ncbi:hypothetical protein SNE40_010512 [Patella caerulea]|uniref:EF-hand domain-containing protein n=1 Tax=Patella caerulea TaxID=87958 RepID=A0AAN8JQL6_PATCE
MALGPKFLARMDDYNFTRFFNEADVNNDGCLTIDEFANVVTSPAKMKLKISRMEIAEVFIDMDTDNDWKITLDEFLFGIDKLRKMEYLQKKVTDIKQDDSIFISQLAIGDSPDSPFTQEDVNHALKDLNISKKNKIPPSVVLSTLLKAVKNLKMK